MRIQDNVNRMLTYKQTSPPMRIMLTRQVPALCLFIGRRVSPQQAVRRWWGTLCRSSGGSVSSESFQTPRICVQRAFWVHERGEPYVNPIWEHDDRLTASWTAVGNRHIRGVTAALRSWLLTHGPALGWLW